jgi:hypothetical protein
LKNSQQPASSTSRQPKVPPSQQPSVQAGDSTTAVGGSRDQQQQHEAAFKTAVAEAGLSPNQEQQLLTYLDFMLETNKSLNLTGTVAYYAGTGG